MTTLAKSRFFNKDKRVAAIFTERDEKKEGNSAVKKEVILEKSVIKKKGKIEEKVNTEKKEKKKLAKKEK